MIDYETRVKLDEIKEKFENLKSLFNPLQVKKEIEKLEKEMTDPNFWNDPKKAEKVSRKAEHLKKELEEFENIEKLFEDIEVAFEFAEEDEEMKEQALEILKKIENTVKNFELDMLLSGPYAESNAFLTVHPGAGGTESHDWAEMLLRMYTRWAEKNGYKVETIDFQPGEVAGVKNATIKIIGNYAYGKLKYESGVHRLVRISPFDAANRRHTSFASVSVVPEIDEEIEIEIKPEELKIETFRASGHGGQHVNKTESAVRITHLPTGIVVTCQNERSQHQNKATALKILKARLYEIEMQKKLQEKMKLLGDIKDISWGNQIRSYVLYPYTMVKDHRTGYETSKAQDVLDGEINDFIEAELLYFAKINKK